MIKSPTQDQKLPTYLRDLSVSAGKEEQDIRSSPGSLGAIISILDLLSTVPTQVNSEMMRVSILKPCGSLGSCLLKPLDLCAGSITPSHIDSSLSEYSLGYKNSVVCSEGYGFQDSRGFLDFFQEAPLSFLHSHIMNSC